MLNQVLVIYRNMSINHLEDIFHHIKDEPLFCILAITSSIVTNRFLNIVLRTTNCLLIFSSCMFIKEKKNKNECWLGSESK